MTAKPLIHYVFRHAIDMVQMQEGENLGAIERVFIEADPKHARKTALSFYTMYCSVLQETDDFNKRMELEEYVRSLHGHPTTDARASRFWNENQFNSEIGCGGSKEEDSTKTEPMAVMVVDASLSDTGSVEEFLIKGGWTTEKVMESGGITNIEEQFYTKVSAN